MSIDIETLDFKKGDGLIPAIIQDATSLRVLMLGYVSEESLKATLETGFVTFYSRSRQCLWRKGETSGNFLRVREMAQDCDKDTLLILADASGPTCHTGTTSCFGEMTEPSLTQLATLEATILSRKENPSEKSYTASLFAEGLPRMAQKVGEEGVEVALAGALGTDNLAEESADLIYHLFVLLAASNKSFKDVLTVLAKRAAPKKP